MLTFFKKKKQTTILEKADKLPDHVAFIMDGNRRWATARGKSTTYGYRIGADVAQSVVRHLVDRGVRTISFYTFSIDNWLRPKEEVDYLMNLFADEMSRHAAEASRLDMRVKFIGRRDVLPKKIMRGFEKYEKNTAENTNGTVVFAVDYGGRDEIVRAAARAIDSGIASADLDMNMFETFLDSGELLPIDLVVRTGGDYRISDFMLWKMAYAELMFLDEQWPDITPGRVDEILGEYATRQRRFGK